MRRCTAFIHSLVQKQECCNFQRLVQHVCRKGHPICPMHVKLQSHPKIDGHPSIMRSSSLRGELCAANKQVRIRPFLPFASTQPSAPSLAQEAEPRFLQLHGGALVQAMPFILVQSHAFVTLLDSRVI